MQNKVEMGLEELFEVEGIERLEQHFPDRKHDGWAEDYFGRP